MSEEQENGENPARRNEDSHSPQIIEGRIQALRDSADCVEFSVARRRARLLKARMSHELREGDHVRIVIGESFSGERLILLVQRVDDGTVQYFGPQTGWKTMLVAMLVAALGVYLSMFWLMAGAILSALVLHGFFERGKRRAIRCLNAHAHPSAAEEAPRRRAPAEIPLALPSSAAHSDWHSAILEFTHDAIIIWEMEGSGIVYWNRAAERMYGFAREEARGKVTHELLQTQIEGGIEELETRLERYGVWIGTLRHTRSDGAPIEVEARLALMSQEHRPWLVLEVNRDVTDRKRAEAERAEIAEQLRRLRKSAARSD